MSLRYIRDTYHVRAYRGHHVYIPAEHAWGVVTRGAQYVWVRRDGERRAHPYHPTDLVYLGLPAASGGCEVAHIRAALA